MAKRPSPHIDLQPHVERLASNIARAHNLVSIYGFLAGPKPGRRSVGDTDVLRSAVVLLHASLEDFLRSLARSYLPHCRPEIIGTIPLKGAARAGRPERFSLGQLSEHRGKTVDQLIEESVDAYLERANYNSSSEVASLLENLDLDVEPVRKFFPELDRMMRRRHQIVHRADCTAETGKGRHRAQSLRVSVVERWIAVVRSFQDVVLRQIQFHEVQDDEQ